MSVDEANKILPGEVESLIDALKSVGGGNLTRDAATNLQKCIKATVLEGKKSTITITLDIKKQGDDMIIIEGATKANIPIKKMSAGFFYSQSNFLPSRNRQDQMTMPFNKEEGDQ
jgi:hypothetical protein